MGMLGHAFEIMITRKKGKPIFINFWLDNEEYFELSKQPDLFADATGINDIVFRLPLAFSHPFEEDEDIREFIEAFDYDGEYDSFEHKVMKLSVRDIDSIVLMTTYNLEYGEHEYRYDWIKYQLSPYAYSTGTGYGEDASDAEEYLLSLESVATACRDFPEAHELRAVPAFDPGAFEINMQSQENQWLQTYGSYVETAPAITFDGKSFVLSGLDALEEEYDIDIQDEIEARGGVVRKSISGKTNYLIVDPKWSGESKVKTAIEQQSKGKPVEIILGTDLIATLLRND